MFSESWSIYLVHLHEYMTFGIKSNNSLLWSVHTRASLEPSGRKWWCAWGGGKEIVPIWWLLLWEAHSYSVAVCLSLFQRFHLCRPPAKKTDNGTVQCKFWGFIWIKKLTFNNTILMYCNSKLVTLRLQHCAGHNIKHMHAVSFALSQYYYLDWK